MSKTIQITGGTIKLTPDGIVQRVDIYDCFPVLTVNASFSGVKDCGCILRGGRYWKLNSNIINQALALHRTVSFSDFTQWESDYPMGFTGALQLYNSVPTETIDDCLDTRTSCLDGCSSAYDDCVTSCAGDPDCILDCDNVRLYCQLACADQANNCMDCHYFDGSCEHDCFLSVSGCEAGCGGDPECLDVCAAENIRCLQECLDLSRSCNCYELDTTCECGAHLVVQCIIPNPDHPDVVSNVELWVNTVNLCGTPAYIACVNGCSGTYASCLDACAGDPTCENICVSAALGCQSACESLGIGCGGSFSDIPVFRFRDVDVTGLFGANDNDLVAVGCGSAQFGKDGSVSLAPGNPAP